MSCEVSRIIRMPLWRHGTETHFSLYLCLYVSLFLHRKPRVIMVSTLSSLILIITFVAIFWIRIDFWVELNSRNASSDNKVGIMTTIGFHCIYALTQITTLYYIYIHIYGFTHQMCSTFLWSARISCAVYTQVVELEWSVVSQDIATFYTGNYLYWIGFNIFSAGGVWLHMWSSLYECSWCLILAHWINIPPPVAPFTNMAQLSSQHG